MSNMKYHVVVIGGGPGGYVSAIRASQLGNKVAIVEKDALGGICLNWGCIPTKSLLRDAEILHLVKDAHHHGIKISKYTVDFPVTIKRSREVAKRLSKGIEYLMKKNKIDHYAGFGKLKSPHEVEVQDSKEPVLSVRLSAHAEGPSKEKAIELQTDHIIIATGASNREFPHMKVDGKRVISYKEALVLEKIPKRLIIIGAGAIGVEFASFYAEYGSKITLIEMLPQILPQEDEEIAQVLAKSFQDRGMEIFTNTRVEKIVPLKDKVKVYVSRNGEVSRTSVEAFDRLTPEAKVFEAEQALLAIGVQGNIEGFGLDSLGIELEKGWIKVNSFYETSVKGIYAIGDVIGPPWLAHVASAEGRVAVEHLSGKNPHPIDYQNIPACTYSRPQVASIGLTEKKAREAGYELKVGRFPMRASGKALAVGEPDGMVKVIFDAKYGELLGCHIIGLEATELIAELGAVRTLETTYEEILRTVHAHPTISEAIMEAVADAYGEAIHI